MSCPRAPTIERPTGFVGSFHVTVAATAAGETAVTTFQVDVAEAHNSDLTALAEVMKKAWALDYLDRIRIDFNKSLLQSTFRNCRF